MSEHKSKRGAERKRWELETSLSGSDPIRPSADAPDGQNINKLAATVRPTPDQKKARDGTFKHRPGLWDLS